jgi:hypothetical protein
LRATAVEQRVTSGASIAEAAQRAAEATDPPSDLNGSSSARWRPRPAEFHWMTFVDHRLHRMAGDDGRFSPSSP